MISTTRPDAPWMLPACIAGAAALVLAAGMFVTTDDAVPMAARSALMILAAVMPLLVAPRPVRWIALYLILGGFGGATVYVFAVGLAGFLLRRIATPST